MLDIGTYMMLLRCMPKLWGRGCGGRGHDPSLPFNRSKRLLGESIIVACTCFNVGIIVAGTQVSALFSIELSRFPGRFSRIHGAMIDQIRAL